LNTHSLKLHFCDVLANPNLLASHILCLNETKIKKIQTNNKLYLAISKKFNIISCYDEHGIMILYDEMVTLTQTNLLTNVGVEFIIALFNNNTQEALYLIAVYKPLKMQVNYFCCILKTIIKQMFQ
jgi:hypothetical protein